MQTSNWNPLVRVLHWLAVLVAVVAVAAIWSHEGFDKTDPLRAQLVQTHFLLGGSLGLLAILRLLTRASTRAPAQDMPEKLKTLSRLAHFGLYALMVVLPVLGFVAASGRGTPINLLGLIELAPLPVDEAFAHDIREVHETLGSLFVWLVIAHAGAALYHAFVLKDKILQAMLGRADR